MVETQNSFLNRHGNQARNSNIEEIYTGNFVSVANVIVVKNHGAIITGASIEHAFDTFFYFEQMVALQLKIMGLSNTNSEIQISEIEPDRIEELQKKYISNSYQLAKQHFDARKRSILEKVENLLETEE